MISFKTTKKDCILIDKIVRRALTNDPLRKDFSALGMDITAVHANGMPLKLKELLASDELSFFHDVWGIEKHIDRETGQLKDCFLPRFAVPKKEKKS